MICIQVLESAVQHTSYRDVKELCTVNLPYIAGQWLAMDYRLSIFPIQLFDSPDLETFMRYVTTLPL